MKTKNTINGFSHIFTYYDLSTGLQMFSVHHSKDEAKQEQASMIKEHKDYISWGIFELGKKVGS